VVGRDPGRALHVLKRGRRAIEVLEEPNAHPERRQREQERRPLDQLVRARRQTENHRHPDEREKRDPGEDAHARNLQLARQKSRASNTIVTVPTITYRYALMLPVCTRRRRAPTS